MMQMNSENNLSCISQSLKLAKATTEIVVMLCLKLLVFL